MNFIVATVLDFSLCISTFLSLHLSKSSFLGSFPQVGFTAETKTEMIPFFFSKILRCERKA